MNVAVLGSGNGGCAVAFDFAAHGHQVSLFDFERFPRNIRAIQDRGGIHAEGELSGFAPVVYAGHDVAQHDQRHAAFAHRADQPELVLARFDPAGAEREVPPAEPPGEVFRFAAGHARGGPVRDDVDSLGGNPEEPDELLRLGLGVG